MGDGPDDGVLRIARGLDATLAAGTARIELTIAHELPSMPASAPSPALMFPAPVRPLARRIGRRVERAMLGPRRADGLIDLRRRIVALDFGRRADLIDGGRSWSGMSGAERPARSGSADWQQPLWLLDLLRGVVAAEARGTEPVAGAACLRLAATADLIRASRAAPGPMAVPFAPSYAALGRLPAECWLDGAPLVRRLHTELEQHSGSVAVTVDFVEFGVPVPHEWPNLPRLRRPTRPGGG